MKELIVWEDKYSVQIKSIDLQHQKLILYLNELYEAINEKKVDSQLKEIFSKIVEYKNEHFDYEEKYFKLFNFEGSKEHIKEHDMFRKQVDKWQNEINHDQLKISFEILDYLEDWILTHLKDVDKEYVSCFIKNGLK